VLRIVSREFRAQPPKTGLAFGLLILEPAKVHFFFVDGPDEGFPR
jgi:hypothetical protein